MEYQDKDDADRSPTELAIREKEIHDKEHQDSSHPMEINPEQFWEYNDHCYLNGRYIRGYRKRRMLELLDLDTIPGKRVLAAGCGGGQQAVFLALHGAEVVGVDLTEEGVRKARQRAKVNGVQDRTSFSVQNLSCLGLATGRFDIVLFNAVLHHALKYPNVKQETFRVLDDDGEIIYAEGIRNNPAYKAIRRTYRELTGRKPKGDVDITHDDIQEFAAGHSWEHSESFCLTLGVKELLGDFDQNPLWKRSLFYLCKKTDDVLLSVAPSLEQYCTETVGRIRKTTLEDQSVPSGVK